MEVEDVGSKWAALEKAGWTGPLFEHALTQQFTVQARDRFGASIVHRAARSAFCHSEAFQRILESLPTPAPQIEFLTYDGCTALHYAAAQGNAFAVQALLKLHPQAAGVADGKGSTPLHRSLTKRRESTYEIVHALLKAYPKAVTMRESQGNLLPLHVAVTAGQTTATVLLLTAVCASAAACSDHGKAKKRLLSNGNSNSNSSSSSQSIPSTATVTKSKPAVAAAPRSVSKNGHASLPQVGAEEEEETIMSVDDEHFKMSAKLARERVRLHMKRKEEEHEKAVAHRLTVHHNSHNSSNSDSVPRLVSAGTGIDSTKDEILVLLASADEEAASDHGMDLASTPAATVPVTSQHRSRLLENENEFELQVVDEEEEGEASVRLSTASPLDVLTRFLSHSKMKPDLPLHMALHCAIVDWNTVLALLDVLPTAAGVPDSLKTWALFIAIRKRAPPSVIKALIEAHPAVLFVRERVFPSSAGCGSTNRAKLAVANAFAEAAAAVNEDEGLSALQLALDTYCRPVRVKEETAVSATVLTSEQIKEQVTAVALQFDKDCESIIALIRAFPLGAFDKQAVTHALPFDYALKNRMWPVCVHLLQYCLKKQRDGAGSIAASLSDADPLVDALSLDAPFHVLRLILEVFPDAGTYERNNSQWPLHTACTMCSDGEAVLLVLRSFPPAAMCCDYFEKYPLHYLCEGRIDPRMSLSETLADVVNNNDPEHACKLSRQRSAVLAVHEVAQAHPAVLSIADNKKRIPFDIARSFTCSASMMNVLLRLFPDPVSRNDGNGVLPFWNIIAHGELENVTGIGFDLAAVFLAHSLPVLRGRGFGSPNPLYRGIWHDVLAEPSDKFQPLIERTLDDVGLYHILAMSKRKVSQRPTNSADKVHADSLTALEAASPNSRHLLLRRMFLFSRFQLPPARDPKAVAPVPAHTTTGGTYYQDQKPDAVPLSSPVRLKAAAPRPTSPGEREAKTLSPSQASPEHPRSRGKFLCGLLAKDQLQFAKQVGILFCRGAAYKDAIHKAELSRAHARRGKPTDKQLQTMRREVSFAAFLAAEAQAAASAGAVVEPTILPAAEASPTGESKEKLDIEEGEKSEAEEVPNVQAPVEAEAAPLLVAPSSPKNKPGWWQQYLQGPEMLEWLDCEAENVLHMTMDLSEATSNYANCDTQISRDKGMGALLTLHRSPSALGMIAIGLIDPWNTPAATVNLLACTSSEASVSMQPIFPASASVSSPGKFVNGTFQTFIAPHHSFPLLCTKPLETQHEFVREQLERALGTDSAARPTFCAVFSSVTSVEDLLSIMRWVEESVHQSELPKPMQTPVLWAQTEPATDAPKIPEIELEPKVEVDCEAALKRAEESTLELTVSALMLHAAQKVVPEHEEAAVTTYLEPEAAIEYQLQVVVEVPIIVAPEKADSQQEPLVPSAPPMQEKSSVSASPRSESLSRQSKERSYAKPPVQQTHRNEALNPSKSGSGSSVGKTQTRMKEKSVSLKGDAGVSAPKDR